MTDASPEPMSETTAFQDLVKWSADRPAWQRDALRRLIQNGALTDQDVEELAAICADPAAACKPVDTSHIAVGSTSTDPIALHAVRAPKGINALAPDQRLEFAPQGLTIIYGDNGSGKSGYVRILKHACRTRDGKVVILRDVEDTANTPQSATITLGRGATVEDVPRRAKLTPHCLIQNVTEDCPPIGVAASANRIAGADGGRDQHGRAARGRSSGGGAVCSGGAARKGSNTR
jgi:hypothetical protein